MGWPQATCARAALGPREKKKPTEIEAFIQAQGKGECSLLRALFKLDERLRIENADGSIGLSLIDPPQHYGDCGTVLYSPRTTPSNSIAFASTGGDDVHFSLVRHGKNLGDNSPVVMTVPVGGDDVRAINLILGSNLHEFLCLGCVHGYFELEQLFYDPAVTIAQLSSPEPNDGDAKAAETLGVYRRELGLKPWKDIGTRLQELDDQFKRDRLSSRGVGLAGASEAGSRRIAYVDPLTVTYRGPWRLLWTCLLRPALYPLVNASHEASP